MWRKSENGDAVRPAKVQPNGDYVFIRRNFVLIPDQTSGDHVKPAHWEYEENCIGRDIYDVVANVGDLEDAVVELAEMIGGR